MGGQILGLPGRIFFKKGVGKVWDQRFTNPKEWTYFPLFSWRSGSKAGNKQTVMPKVKGSWVISVDGTLLAVALEMPQYKEENLSMGY